MLHHLKDSSDAIVYNLIRWADVQTLLPSSSSWSSWSSWSSPSSRCCGVPIMLITPRSGSSKPIRRSPTLSLQTHGSFPPALTSHQYVPIRADSVTRSNPSAESNHSFVLFLSVLPVFSCQTSFFLFFSAQRCPPPPLHQPSVLSLKARRTTFSSSSSAQRTVVEGQAYHGLLVAAVLTLDLPGLHTPQARQVVWRGCGRARERERYHSCFTLRACWRRHIHTVVFPFCWGFDLAIGYLTTLIYNNIQYY